jgi:hypothetical protein
MVSDLFFARRTYGSLPLDNDKGKKQILKKQQQQQRQPSQKVL